MGGLFQSLISMFGVGVSYLASRLFISKIVSKVYHIRKYENFKDFEE